MRRSYLSVLILFSIIYYGCSPDELTVQVIRNPIIKFNLNGASWKSDKYSFTTPSMVVVYPSDTTQPGKFYNRITLQSTGRDINNKNLQLIISFDNVDASQLVGIYSPSHTALRGLASAQLYDLTNANNLQAYQLCNDNLQTSLFQIQKQKQDERLVSGVFQITMCNVRDTTQKIEIIDGTFTDIKY
ncbi:MAG: hypothetical protein ABIN94_01485 [Ferruginibacter sp.]